MFKRINHYSDVREWSDDYLRKMYYYYRCHFNDFDSDARNMYVEIYNEYCFRRLCKCYDH